MCHVNLVYERGGVGLLMFRMRHPGREYRNIGSVIIRTRVEMMVREFLGEWEGRAVLLILGVKQRIEVMVGDGA